MDYLDLIISSVISLITSGSIFSFLFFKLDKRLKTAEVKRVELENNRTTLEEWKELYNENEEERKSLFEKYNLVITEKEGLLEVISNLKMENANLKLKNAELQWSRCIVNGCNKRKPKRNYDQDDEPVE